LKIKRLIVIVVSFLILFFSLSYKSKANTAIDISIPATYSYEILLNGEWNIVGTAFMYKPGLFKERNVVTAKHVAVIGDKYPARICEIKKPKCYFVYGHNDHPKEDVSILKILGKPSNKKLLMGVKPKVGEFVYVVGFPFGELHVTSGIVTRVTSKYIYIDARVIPGNSGGPVVNESGEVIGIVSSIRILNNGQLETNWAYIVPIEKIHEIKKS